MFAAGVFDHLSKGNFNNTSISNVGLKKIIRFFSYYWKLEFMSFKYCQKITKEVVFEFLINILHNEDFFENIDGFVFYEQNCEKLINYHYIDNEV